MALLTQNRPLYNCWHKTKYDSWGLLCKIYVKLENENAGLTKMRSDIRYASEKKVILIVKIEINFSVSLNSGPTIHWTHLPLTLVFACAVDKF